MTSSDGTRPVDRAEVIGAGVQWSARWSLRVALVAVGIGLGVWLIGQLWSIFLPIFLALILATLLRPPTGWLIHHRVPPALAALGVLLGALVVLAGVFYFLERSAAGQVGDLAQSTVGALGQLRNWVTGPPLDLGGGQLGSIVDSVTQRLQQSAASIASTALAWLANIVSILVTVVLAVVLAFLFVKDGDRFLPFVRRLGGATAGPHLEAGFSRSWRALGSFIRTQALVGLADAVFIGIGLVVLGIPLAVPLAVLTFFAAFVPIVGAVVAGALAVLIALVSHGLTTALVVLGIVVAVQQIEGNILQPILQGHSLGLHPAVVLLAVTAGGSIYGIVGALFAVPVAAVATEVLRYLNEQIDARTGLPRGTAARETVSETAGDDESSPSEPVSRPSPRAPSPWSR